ncbi:3-hydroxy-fatty acyl-ACP dehydratase [Ewingella americana]|uniref:3-hydroxy-fatty acyl-ACP dehydratase n=1 Tax=Ewingella americana TaxID=41202 RepID=A0A502G1P4_9GAMM|nr:3-hydroxy-fatty acyl-ACP dehydratase [Ewingella americana]TPG55778.1 3-hydroxy-fatty acyl-ACP dehydratase [Ewingella americana]
MNDLHNPVYAPPAHYLPHNAPMVLLDEVISVGKESAHCSSRVSTTGALAPFLTAQGALPAWFSLELMAQTIGVWNGWHNAEQGDLPQLGMLLGCRGMRCAQPEFASGAQLDMHIQQILRDSKIASFECTLFIRNARDDGPVAHARLNTYQPDAQDILSITQGRQP